MSLVEGVGDEVLLMAAVLLLCLVLAVAWLSTHVPETQRPLDAREEQRQGEPLGDEHIDQAGVVMDEILDSLIAGDGDENPIESDASISEGAIATSETRNDANIAAAVDNVQLQADVSSQSASVVEEISTNENLVESLDSQSRTSSSAPKTVESCECPENEPLVSEHQPGTSSPDLNSAGSDLIRVKVKFFNEAQRQVNASKTDTIGHFKRTHFQPELSENKLVKLIYEGRLLADDQQTLDRCRVRDGSVLHCLVRDAPQQNSDETSESRTNVAPAPEGVAGLDPSRLMVPGMIVLLAIAWYTRITHKHLFTAPATVALIALTFLLVFGLYCAYRVNRVDARRVSR